MSTAAKILVMGGLFNLFWGFGTGAILGRIRSSSPAAPKYLALTHVGGLMWAPILFGLVLATELSRLTAWVLTSAAIAMVAASLALDLKDLINWQTHVEDEFAPRGVGYRLGSVSATLFLAATIALSIGVIRGL